MSDFSKDPLIDEQAPSPIAPSFSVPEVEETIDEDQARADQETDQKAAAYWHPAWEHVQTMFEEKIAAFRGHGGAIAHQEKSPEEFKIAMLVDAMVANHLEEIMKDVQDAVESVEHRPKQSKRSTKRKK